MSASALALPIYLAPLVALTLLHFVWQGMALAGLLVIVLSAMRGQSAARRYAISVTVLALMACAPIITGTVLLHSTTEDQVQHRAGTATSSSHTNMQPARTGSNPTISGAMTTASGSMRPWTERLTDHAELIVALWISGIALLSLRTLGGWLLLRCKFAPADSSEVGSLKDSLRETVQRIATKMGIARLPEVRLSARVQGPLMFGALRAVIVLPVGALTGLSPEMLETIIAHELAHIVRHDYLVNMIQCAIETVLFYHPAVWWVSRRIRDERELCCDDRVVACLQDRFTYARALAGLEELRVQHLTVAATGGSLQARIQHILGVESVQKDSTFPFATGLSALLLAVALSLSLHTSAGSQTDNSPPDRTGQFAKPLPPLKPGEGPYDPRVFIPVEGAGIEITLKDSTRKLAAGDEPGNLLIHDTDLQKLVHTLWQAGARAIAIGNERIETGTQIHAKGPDITVNNRPVPIPFVVRVLGDSEALTKQIMAQGGVLEQLSKIDPAMVTVKTLAKVTLPHATTDDTPKLQYNIHMRFIRCEMSAEGVATETVISNPWVRDIAGMPATVGVHTDAPDGKEIESSEMMVLPEPGGPQRIKLKASLKIREVGGKPMSAQTEPDLTIAHSKQVRILGIVSTTDAVLKKAVESGKVVKDHGAYHAFYLEVKVD